MGWKAPYIGHYHEILLKQLHRARKESVKKKNSTNYTNHVAVLQSSGSGKSRLVHEMGNKVFCIPINLRSEEESKNGKQIYSLIKPHLLEKYRICLSST